MKKEIADKWIKALRSGKYKQGKFNLCSVEGKTARYCCLGVLCHILGTPYTKHNRYKVYNEESVELPVSVKDVAGMKSSMGYLSDSDSLGYLNDWRDKSFKEIANIIESRWEEL